MKRWAIYSREEKRSKNGRMEQPKAMECGSRKVSPDVLKPHVYIYMCVCVCGISSAELWPVLLLCVLKEYWYQLPGDGKTITPKHAGAV